MGILDNYDRYLRKGTHSWRPAVEALEAALGVRVWTNAGVPASGPAPGGTKAGLAEKGDLLIDTTNAATYQNTNTKSSPTWTVFSAGSITYGIAGEMAVAGTGTANAAGATGKAARIDHVHALGTHDHSAADKGAQLTPSTAFAANSFDNATLDSIVAASGFAADADSRAKFADGIWTTGKLADGVLSADAAGRAKMAAGFYGAGDATSRALFADLFMDATFCAAKIADNAIPGVKVNWSYGVTPSTIQADDSAAGGSSGQVARADHVHGIVCAAPSAGLAAADAEGGATSFARSNHVHKAVLADGVSFLFGSGDDAGLGWQTGDASNHTLVLGLADANQALHISDLSAVGTDWNVGADTHPSLYLHSDTTPATDYIKMWHDATSGFLEAVGGSLSVTGVGEVVFNDAGADVDFRVESANVDPMFIVDAGMDTASFGAAGSAAKFLGVSSTARTLASAAEYAAVHIEPAGAVTTAGDGSTSDYITSLYIAEPNIVNGGGDTVTIAATVFIKDAPTEGAANYALYVAAGAVNFGGALGVSGAITASGGLNVVDQKLDFTTGYIEFGATPAASGGIRQENNVAIWAARNAANGADVTGWKVNAADDYEAAADVNLAGNVLYGGTADNADLTLAATTSATVTTSYIITNQMLDATVNSLAIRVKAGAVGDGETAQTDLNGELAIDSANGRLYFRYGAAWHYAAQDAGFQVNALETDCPVCGKPIEIGQEVVGLIEKTMEDGALHGLWKHASCPR